MNRTNIVVSTDDRVARLAARLSGAALALAGTVPVFFSIGGARLVGLASRGSYTDNQALGLLVAGVVLILIGGWVLRKSGED